MMVFLRPRALRARAFFGAAFFFGRAFFMAAS
jgi:hypothetical protein